tara:strand:+ start:2676 stop:4097 length:1422 start_codon:yes stop_codon:yes gene_type:complete
MGILTDQGVNASGYSAIPSKQKQTVSSAYLDLANTANQGWAQQYLPDLMEKEAEIFGNRTLAGFLERVGAEEASASDQIVWSEQGRLHVSIAGAIVASTGVITTTDTTNAVRIGDMVLLNQANKGTLKCYVTAAGATTLTVKPYTQAACDTSGGIVFIDGAVTGFVFGSEYVKGVDGRTQSIEPDFKSHSNQMIIMKDLYEVSGSDASQIGWVEVSGEEGQSGYMWYLKAAGDTRARFADYCEMALIESEKAATSSGVEGIAGNLKGSEGLFAAIKDRGIMAETATNGSLTLNAEFDNILKEFDKQGAIEEYMMFLNREQALNVDDMLAGMNSYGGSGTSYGVFDNSEDMALNLGFSGFRRGSYDFYKTDWKYLNDNQTRGGLNNGTVDVEVGVFVPAGVSSVYDQGLGKNLKRPFLHVRYRSAGIEDRRFKTWTTGSVGASTSSLDAMEMHFLTERCLVVQGANNFCTLMGA